MDTPGEKCGFVLTSENVDQGPQMRRPDAGPFKETCCWRDSWGEHDRCVWHAQVDEKPVSALMESRSSYPERFDGAYLVGVDFGYQIPFDECTLHGAKFDRSNLEGASFRAAEGIFSSFSNCELSFCSIQEARFFHCDFSRSNMQIITAQRTNLHECDFGRTIIGGDFQGSDIMGCDFSKSEKGPLDFTGSRLVNVDFSDSIIPLCKMMFVDGTYLDFSNTDLGGCDFSFSNLHHGDFENASIRDSYFVSSNLEESKFSLTSISESDFRYSDLYRCLFQNTTIDSLSKFGGHYQQTNRPIVDVDEFLDLNSMWKNKVSDWGGESDKRLIEKRAWTHEALKETLLANSLTKPAKTFHLLRKDAQRDLAALSGKITNRSWIGSTVEKYLMGYGEKPSLVVFWSGITILLYAILYTLTGGVDTSAVDSEGGALLGPILGFQIEFGTTFLSNFYFSSLTFSTLGYGDLQPSTWSVRLLATSEALVGALLMALFVFVLGRRSNW